MKKLLLTVGLVIGIVNPVLAHHTNRVEATISRVDPLYSNSVQHVPRQVCQDVQVPVYSTVPGGGASSGDVFTGMVLGALIGNAITDTNKGGQAGAVFGGLMAADKKKSQKVISGYQTQRQCQTVYDNVSSQHITGYKIWFTHNGMTGTATTTTKYRVGQKIQVKMGISID
jgi:hypothetical protein